jgi:RNA polymerase sigma factor (TIGR02999 family)
MSDVTQILAAMEHGDPAAAEALLPLVYDELRKLAASKLAWENPGQTLQPTALVHEAFLRLVKSPEEHADQVERQWAGRGHFFSAAAEAMRRLLVENARRKGRHKHGGDRQRIALEAAAPLAQAPSEDLVALDEALTRLTAHDPIKAEVVNLRFFAGLSMPEIARMLGLSLATVERHWAYARTWLYSQVADGDLEQSPKKEKSS